MTHEERTWAEINLSAFRHNWQTLRNLLPSKTSIMAVVKADAYGHGLIPLSKAAAKAGAAYLGVSSVEEGIALRRAGIKKPILILGSLFPFGNFPLLFKHHLTPTLASLVMAEALSKLASKRKETIAVHVEVDTGMGRTGVMPATALDLLSTVVQLPGLKLEGLYTHLASSDVDPEFTQQQIAIFHAIVKKAAVKKIVPRWIHWGNSAAIFIDQSIKTPSPLVGEGGDEGPSPQRQFVPSPKPSPTGGEGSDQANLIRPGLALYGVSPFAQVPLTDQLQPVLTWKTRVIFLKTVPAGASVSYARTWTARRVSRIATLSVGYADGLPRLLSNRGEVLIRGRRAPILGRVTMDMTMVDVTEVPECVVGDEAVLIGSQGEASISALELAALAETNSYEILCGISARVPRLVMHG